MEWWDDPLRPARSAILLEATGADSTIVHLRPENEAAARIFQLVRGQVITRHGTNPESFVEELNHLAVWAAIDGYGVPDRTRVFELVLAAFGRVGSR